MQHEDRLCWSCRKIPQADLFMSFGVFAEAARVPQFCDGLPTRSTAMVVGL